MRVRGVAAVRKHRAARQVPLVAPSLRETPQERVRPQGEGDGRLPPRQLQGPLQDPGVAPVLAAQPPQAAGALAEGALRGGGEAAGAAAGGGGQVPCETQVPPAAHHLGR